MGEHLNGAPASPPSRIGILKDDGSFELIGDMSLRDWLAGQALGGVMHMICSGQHDAKGADGIAESCYRIADAMLAARDGGPANG